MIQEFSKMTDSDKLFWETQIKKHLETGILEEPTTEYNEFGLKFSPNHLKQISISLIFLPVEYMAKYVDQVTKQNVDSGNCNTYKVEQFVDTSKPIDFDCMNATSIGNLAYVYLNMNEETEKQKFKDLLDKIFIEWHQHIYLSLVEFGAEHNN